MAPRPSPEVAGCETFFCLLCQQHDPIEDQFVVSACQHAFCRDIIRRYLVERINVEDASPVCPVVGCGASISDADMVLVLSEDEQQRYYDLSLNKGKAGCAVVLDFFCEICQSEDPVEDQFLIGACQHAFCRDTIHQYLVDRINAEDASPKCPIDTCGATISDADMSLVLTEDEQRQYYELSFKMGVQTAPDIHRCLDENCSGAASLPEGDSYFECPLCGSQRCVACNTRAWHQDETCEQFQRRVRNNELQPEQLRALFGNNEKMYQCGRCSFGPIEHFSCGDLEAHHGEDAGHHSRVNNACPQCGWFAAEISQWPKWDGVAWSERHPDGPPPPAPVSPPHRAPPRQHGPVHPHHRAPHRQHAPARPHHRGPPRPPARFATPARPPHHVLHVQHYFDYDSDSDDSDY